MKEETTLIGILIFLVGMSILFVNYIQQFNILEEAQARAYTSNSQISGFITESKSNYPFNSTVWYTPGGVEMTYTNSLTGLDQELKTASSIQDSKRYLPIVRTSYTKNLKINKNNFESLSFSVTNYGLISGCSTVSNNGGGSGYSEVYLIGPNDIKIWSGPKLSTTTAPEVTYNNIYNINIFKNLNSFIVDVNGARTPITLLDGNYEIAVYSTTSILDCNYPASETQKISVSNFEYKTTAGTNVVSNQTNTTTNPTGTTNQTTSNTTSNTTTPSTTTTTSGGGGGGGGGSPSVISYEDDTEELVCADDVMECSDGSYVSRNVNNNCEFDLCPKKKTNYTLIILVVVGIIIGAYLYSRRK